MPFGDVATFVSAVEQAACLYDQDLTAFKASALAAQAYAVTTFSPEREREDLRSAFADLLRRHPHSC